MEPTPDEMAYLVTETVSDALELPITELPPLSETIDLDALAVIVSSTATDPPGITITFSYAGLRVSVYSEPVVSVHATPRDRAYSVD